MSINSRELMLVSISIDGYSPNKDEITKFDEVTFHAYTDSNNLKKFLGSVILLGERDSIKERALELIDDALTKLIFALGMILKINDNDYYITPLEAYVSVDSSIIGEKTIHRVGSTSTHKYRIGEDSTKSVLASLSSVKHDKKNSLVKALNIYRVAAESNNPYQAIETYFSCMKTIVRENTGSNHVIQADLKCALKKTITSEDHFDDNFARCYGKERSGGTHGSLDLLDRSSLRGVIKDALHVKEWAKGLILDYADKNQVSPG